LELVFVLGNFPQGFVLPRQMHVADLFDRKRDGTAARSRVGGYNVAQQRSDEVGGLRIAAAARRDRTPGSENSQFAVTRGAWIG
jgi:hypothetical protein